MANNHPLRLDMYPFRPVHMPQASAANAADASVSPTLLSQWREANRAASDAERLLFDASMLHLWGVGPEATAEQRSGAARHRQAERELFNAAMLHYGVA